MLNIHYELHSLLHGNDHQYLCVCPQMKAAREKLGRPCSMCQNYEAQLQECQELKKRGDGQLRTLERQLDGERQAHKNHAQYTKELEQKLKDYTEDAEDQVCTQNPCFKTCGEKIGSKKSVGYTCLPSCP